MARPHTWSKGRGARASLGTLAGPVTALPDVPLVVNRVLPKGARLAVPCPTCAAPEGAQCRSLTNGKPTAHESRRRVAIRAARQEGLIP